MKQILLNGGDIQLERLSKIGDPLEKISKVIDFEIFRTPIENAIRKADYTKGGCPPKDAVMMFKIMLLQQSNGSLGDDKTEYLINCRLDWMRFLGLELGEKSPDAKTIWVFKEQLKEAGLLGELSDLFNCELNKKGLIGHEGTLVDATFVDAPRRHTTKKEDETLKQGEFPLDFFERKQNSCKDVKHSLSQTDTDARWAKKGDETHFGYKSHNIVDKDSKIVLGVEVTPASVHDSKMVVVLIMTLKMTLFRDFSPDLKIWADSGYVGKKLQEQLKALYPYLYFYICAKGYRNKPLNDEQKASNRKMSRTRSRVEHVFGAMTNEMGGIFIRCIGIERATRDIIAKNLAYNVKRAAFLLSQNRFLVA